MVESFFGVARVSECYHRSRNCPAIRALERKNCIDVREYGGEQDAFDHGHIRRCRLCSGQRVFQAAPEPKKADRPKRRRDKDYGLVRLTDSQHEALVQLSTMTKGGGPTTLRELAAKRNRSVVATFLLMKRLAEMGLVRKKIDVGHRKAKSRTLEPTEEGHRIAAMIPLSDDAARALSK